MTKKSSETQSIPLWETDPVAHVLQSIHYEKITKGLRSISIASDVREEGKTTTAILIARGLFEVFKAKVLYVDLNPQGDALLSKYLKSYTSLNGIVEKSVFPFEVLRIKDMEIDWSKNVFDGPFLNRLITSYSNYDFIVVDTYNPSSETDSILKINTDSNLIIKSTKSKGNRLEEEIARDRKNVIGYLFNDTSR